MGRAERITVGLESAEAAQVRHIVEAGEFASAAAVIREALRVWLQRRTLHAGPHGAQRLSRSLAARREPVVSDPVERVELLFDAGDASGG
jgi:Arc/MetJ-type ribon-helix-helix transcriptional regulator